MSCGVRSACKGRAKSRKRVTSALSRLVSVEMYPASSVASGFDLSQLLGQHFRRAFDHSQRIANLVRESGGKLAESGETLGTPRLGLRLLEAAVRFGEGLSQFLIALRLAAALNHEAVHHHRSEKEE